MSITCLYPTVSWAPPRSLYILPQHKSSQHVCHKIHPNHRLFSWGGFGAALALVLAQRGHHVFATSRSVDTIPDALKSSANVTVLPLDVADAAIGHSSRKHGRGVRSRAWTWLVNNAGVGYVRPRAGHRHRRGGRDCSMSTCVVLCAQSRPSRISWWPAAAAS